MKKKTSCVFPLMTYVAYLFIGLLGVRGFFVYAADYNPLPDTGQTRCYDVWGDEIACPLPGEPLYGQDANYQGLQQSFTRQVINGDNITIDNYTGLMWMTGTADTNHDGQIDSSDKLTWVDSGNYCRDLTYAGYSDWRLPAMSELITIIDYSKWNPAINSTYFFCKKGWYWSSTTGTDLSTAHVVGFNYGGIGQPSKAAQYWVRCVRGSDLNHNFQNNNDYTVTDQLTGLMWENDDNVTNKTRTWADGLAYCENLTLAGYTDWRLPNIRELRSIVDYTRSDPAIDEIFLRDRGSYWSSTSFAPRPYQVEAVEFYYGGIYTFDKTGGSYLVRCVRPGLSGAFHGLTVSIAAESDSTDNITSNVGGIACLGGSPNTGTCMLNYIDTAIVTLTAHPGSGHSFTGWGGDCSSCGNTLSCNVTMSSDRSCIALFELTARPSGDVNGDGHMDIVDALLVARYAVNLSVSNFDESAADVNCDGDINIIDALFIARKAVGLSVNGWCGD